MAGNNPNLDPVARVEHDQRMLRCDDRFKRNEEDIARLEGLSTKLTEGNLKLTFLAEQQQRKNQEQDQFNETTHQRILSLEMQPGKRWNSLTSQLITIIIAAVAGVLLGLFGIK